MMNYQLDSILLSSNSSLSNCLSRILSGVHQLLR